MDAAHALSRSPLDTRWRERLERTIVQEPLVFTRPSLAALAERDPAAAPTAVMLGIGLCTPDTLTLAMPYDLLGLILPAERVRRAVGASTIVALVADTHARTTGFDDRAVEHRARAAVSALLRVRARFGLDSLCVVRASRLHATTRYREWLRTARARGGPHASPYLVRQVADVACLDERLGSIVKLGWMVGAKRDDAVGDEAAFDRWVEPWSRRRPVFTYVRAGRTLDPERPKAPPYVEVEPPLRITLGPDERVAEKLARAPESDPLHGVANHLRAIARTYTRTVGPLDGPIAERTQSILDRLYRPGRADPGGR